MSDSDDWEKNAEKDDAALDEILKTGKFGDEQAVPVVEEVKVAPGPAAKVEEGKGKKKEKPKKKGKAKAETLEIKPEAKAKAEIIAEGKKKEEIADHEITDELFGVKPVTLLSTDDNYLDYAREVNRMLANGQYHFRLPVFFNELLKETTKLMKPEEINKVIAILSVIHTERLKSEKGSKKTNSKPGLKADVNKKIQLEEEEDEEYNEYEDFL